MNEKKKEDILREIEEKMILVAVSPKGKTQEVEESLEELEELAKTAGATTVGYVIQNLEKPNPKTYVGSGKILEIQEMVETMEATGIVTDDELSPVQLKNLEAQLQCKVVDRSLLILDIFAKHAHTREGILQVELAQQSYRLSRLIGIGASLSRLGGGIGTKGPGEKKLETDRRHIRNRISQLKQEIDEAKRHRNLLRENRKKHNKPVIAIAGYTNAGKSTLLNALTQANVIEEDKLFATLDTTTRQCILPEGKETYITDTVGFINKLPHHLVEAFKSTLEEVAYADVIIHVVDGSSPYYDKHMKVFYDTIDDLGATSIPVVTVFNKMDRYKQEIIHKDARAFSTTKVSALHKKGLEELQEILETKLQEGKEYIKIILPYDQSHIINNIRTYGQILKEEYENEGTLIEAYIDIAYVKMYSLDTYKI